MNAQKHIDWAQLRDDWESGTVSFVDLGEAYGVDPLEIKARCEQEGWPKLNIDILTLGLRGRTVTERILGISSARFYDLESEGIIAPVKDGKFNLLPTIRRVVRYYAMAAAGRTPGKLEQLKIDHEAEKVALARQKREIQAGDLVYRKDMEVTLKAIFRFFHDEYTDRSAKIAYAIADEHDPASIKLALEAHDRVSLDRVADRIEREIGNPVHVGESAPGPAPETERVGDSVS